MNSQLNTVSTCSMIEVGGGAQRQQFVFYQPDSSHVSAASSMAATTAGARTLMLRRGLQLFEDFLTINFAQKTTWVLSWLSVQMAFPNHCNGTLVMYEDRRHDHLHRPATQRLQHLSKAFDESSRHL